MAGACECGEEPSGSIKCGGNFLIIRGLVRSSGRILIHDVSYMYIKNLSLWHFCAIILKP